MHHFVDWCTNLALILSFGVEQLAVIMVSTIPLIELKGAIPVGVKLDLGLWESFWWAFLGSSFVCIPTFFILKLHFKFKWFNRVVDVFRSKAKKLIEKTSKSENKNTSPQKLTFMKCLGVFAFAAIPIPLTGVYTSTFVAILVDLKFRFALPCIVLGNFVAGLCIVLLTFLLGSYLDLFLVIILALCAIFLAIFLWKVFKPSKKGDTIAP